MDDKEWYNCKTYMHHQSIVNVHPKSELLFMIHPFWVDFVKTSNQGSMAGGILLGSMAGGILLEKCKHQ